jgi:hypothetical protein
LDRPRTRRAARAEGQPLQPEGIGLEACTRNQVQGLRRSKVGSRLQ